MLPEHFAHHARLPLASLVWTFEIADLGLVASASQTGQLEIMHRML